jgi:hypothetical protein
MHTSKEVEDAAMGELNSHKLLVNWENVLAPHRDVFYAIDPVFGL